MDALVASVLPRDGGVGDEARHNTAGSMAWSACSIPSCIGDGARTEWRRWTVTVGSTTDSTMGLRKKIEEVVTEVRTDMGS